MSDPRKCSREEVVHVESKHEFHRNMYYAERLWQASDDVLRRCRWVVRARDKENALVMKTLSVGTITREEFRVVLRSEPFTCCVDVFCEVQVFADDKGNELLERPVDQELKAGLQLFLSYTLNCDCECGERVPVGGTWCPNHAQPDVVIEDKP